MADLKIQHNPWSTQITHPDQFTASDQWQWHQGTEVLFNKKKNWSGASSNNFTTNGITWYRQGAAGNPRGSQKTLWTSTGFTSSMYNAKNYNQVFFFGSSVDDAFFTDDKYTYKESSKSSFVRNVIGFASKTDIGGSFSDAFGSAQARLEKIAFFYMHPTTRVRSSYQLKDKLGGSVNLNASLGTRNKEWFTYRVDTSAVTSITDNKLLFMGIGMQFYHGSKPTTHTTENCISQFRIITGTSAYPGNYTQASTLYCIPQVHAYSERSNPQCYSVP